MIDKVIESVKYVVKNSKEVKINEDKIREFCDSFNSKNIRHWLNESPLDFSKLSEDDKLNFLLIFNSISFSYWGNPKWTISYKGEDYDGSWGMIASIIRAIENKKPILNSEYIAYISEKEFKEILKGNIEIPLFEERLNIIKEVGEILIKNFNGEFINLVKKAKGDAIKLLDLIINSFPCFSDVLDYKGKKIYFYKRAQLLIADIYQLFEGKGYGNLKNINKLTACADYKLPQVLRHLGILEYSPNLSKKIDNMIELPRGSNEEIEIRANTIEAVERIKKILKDKNSNIDSIHVNDHLWLLGQEDSFRIKPYHRTRTTSY